MHTLQSDNRPQQITGFAGGDMDGDGDIDLVVATDGSGDEDQVWLNAGGGAYTMQLPVPGSRFRSHRLVSLGDVDGDGDLDALFGGGGVANYNPSQPYLALNDGTGQLGVSAGAVPQTNGEDTHLLELHDFDGDGDLDVLCRIRFDVSYWENIGSATGQFSDQTAAAFSVAPQAGYSRLIDMNGDGVLDLATGEVPRIYICDGAGSFTQLAGVTLPARIDHADDFNGDGVGDIVSGSTVYLNDGFGTGFAAVNGSNFPWTGRGGTVVDLDGDGKLELVCGSIDRIVATPEIYTDIANLRFVDASTTFFEPHVLVNRREDFSYVSHAVVDVDGDGDLDVLTGGSEGRSQTSTTVGIPPGMHLSVGVPPLIDGARSRLPFYQKSVAAIAIGDVDGNGNVDIYMDDAQAVLWLQNDRGEFLDRPMSAGSGDAAAAELVDMDGDGDLDLVTARGWHPQVPPSTVRPTLALNDGAGNFTAASVPMPAIVAGSALAIGDVDGDGDPDVLVGTQDPVYFSFAGAQDVLLLNDGQGSFTDATSAQLPVRDTATRNASFADLDGDGDLDLVIENGWQRPPVGAALLVYVNDGSGVFTDETAARIPLQNSARHLAALDLDEDGDVDLSFSGGRLINDGFGYFQAVASTTSAIVANLDLDAEMEVVELDGSLRVDGQTFSWGYNYVERTGLLADLDRDGDLDLVVGCVTDRFRTQWGLSHSGILYNMLRDLDMTSLPRIGQPLTIAMRAIHGSTGTTLAIPILALGLASSSTTVPGLGEFRLDPVTAVTLPIALLVSPSGEGEVTIPIPASTNLVGLELASQALFIPVGNESAMHFSNAVVREVLR